MRNPITRIVLIFMVFVGTGLVLGNVFNIIGRPPLAEIKPRIGHLCPASFAYKDVPDPELFLVDMELVIAGNVGDIEFSPATSPQTPCVILVHKPPETNVTGAEWRLGINIPDPKKYRGQTVTGSFVLYVASETSLPNSSYYVHDGASGAERGIPALKVDEDNVLTFIHKVSPEATVLQFWLRLVSSSGVVLSPGAIELKRFELEALSVDS